ncbi:MAG: YceI family protein [Verrucomicrobiales bacterium]
MNTVDANEVAALLETGATLIDVLPEENFEAEHIPRAINACVYEMAFVGKVEALLGDRDRDIITYGAGAGSLDAPTAAAKLRGAGYTRVHVFAGGLAEWKANGRPVGGTGIIPGPFEADAVYVIDPAASVIRWTGRNLFNFHHGTLRLAGGELQVDHGILRSGEFEIDMNSMACDDLTDAATNALLIRHLRDDDFFDVDRFPAARCQITRATPIPGATLGTPNFQLEGAMTVRGITEPIAFPAVIAQADADNLTGQAQFEFDRTRFGSQYGSGRFFAFLGRHVVNDHVQLHVKLNARRI